MDFVAILNLVPCADDACGGQWMRTLQNVVNLTQSLQTHVHPVHAVVAFDGYVGSERLDSWVALQLETRAKIELVS
jgi:hypothetical protein